MSPFQSVDAAREDGSLGRLVNDDYKHPNCKMKRVITEGKPHLCLFALKDINEGEEITYDYGGTDWPWRKQVCQKCVAVPVKTDYEYWLCCKKVRMVYLFYPDLNQYWYFCLRLVLPSSG